jgi:predicted nucleic acid-binding protein
MTRRGFDDARRVFVDTAGYYAFVNRRDANHTEARATLEWLLDSQRWLFTTNFVLAEIHAMLLTRMGRSIAARALSEIDDNDEITVIRVNVADEARAREIIHQYQDKDFSLTDATSFAVMERLGIAHAFTFDHNFAQYGFIVLPASRPR